MSDGCTDMYREEQAAKREAELMAELEGLKGSRKPEHPCYRDPLINNTYDRLNAFERRFLAFEGEVKWDLREIKAMVTELSLVNSKTAATLRRV